MTVKGLVLSVFPGADLLGRGFTQAGYCVVRGGDPLFGQEPVEALHPPAGVFEGVIGGPPCQRWAQSHNLAGDKEKHPNLIPEFERVVWEAQPRWFLMENVRGAPVPAVEGYEMQTQVIYAWELGSPQRRPRRFSFGSRDGAMIMWPRGEKPPLGALTLVAKKDMTTLQREVLPTLGTAPTSQRMRCGLRAWRDPENNTTAFTLAEYKRAFGLPESWDAKALLKRSKFYVLGESVPVCVAYALARVIRAATSGETKLDER